VQRKVHARIASVLEEQFAELAAARPDLLALHHAAADQKARAIGYAMQAARSALMGSAYSHAIRHARDAIGWLEAVPDAPRADPDPGHRFDDPIIAAELDLRVTLGVPLMMTQGFASKEVEANYSRLLELCQLAGDRAAAQQFPALWNLWISGRSAATMPAPRKPRRA
jgi:predicted ATPase